MPVIRQAFRPADVEHVAERFRPMQSVSGQGIAVAPVRQASAVQRTGAYSFRFKLLLPQDTAEADCVREIACGKRRDEPYVPGYAEAAEGLTGMRPDC